MNIGILLPFKENYNELQAGAVSLFVKDINKNSKFRKKTTIFGSTKSKKFLSKNYINLELSRNFLKSTNKEYVRMFINKSKEIPIDILEIHNRPSYIKYLKSSFSEKIFLYFHNDPLSMEGSKSLNERYFLLNNTDKLFFNSQWSRNRFFLGFEKSKILHDKTTICYQSTNNVVIDFKKKEKIISFIGKLNKSKGYDIFGNSILKILNKYKDWKAIVIGNEKREKIYFDHKRLKILGFKDNDFVLNYLKKVSISVVCSRWEEPFGRTSLEAASRGSAVIISNKGGLPETTNSAIILKKLNSVELSKKIEFLIKNEKFLIKIQKENYKNFYLTHKFVTKIIDDIRKSYSKFKVNIKRKSNFNIMRITNFNQRFNGRLHYNTGKRINNGLIRLGHNVLTISDRDILNQSKTIIDYKGSIALQKNILENFNNFKPDLVILGHADSVSPDTLNFIKNKNSMISQWFLDPLGRFGPDYKNNKRRITEKNEFIDSTFLTSDPSSLDFKIDNSYFIPNPVDKSFETLENYKHECENDLFFAMSHGVHRGQLKKGKHDKREYFVNKLIKMNKEIKFDIYGMNSIQPIWADEFITKISNSSMGLNLSRGKPMRYYSSDRIAQLIGNGLLTFVDEDTCLNEIISDDKIVFYKNIKDLSYKINKFKKDQKLRKKIAEKGRNFYFKYLNSTLVADYIIKKTFDISTSNNFIWEK